MISSDIYKNRKTQENPSNRKAPNLKVTKVEWIKGQGAIVTIDGAEYPQKGITPQEALFCFDIVKRILIQGVQNIKLLSPIALRKKNINRLVNAFNAIAHKATSMVIMDKDYLTPVSSELQNFLVSFFQEIGIIQGQQLAETLSHIIEYDTAYRYRFQDIATETSKEQLMENPRKEVQRLLELYKSRELKEYPEVTAKIVKIGKLLNYALYLPKISTAFHNSISAIHFEKLQYDEADAYWACMREDYNYMGATKEFRAEMIKGLRKPNVYENV